MSFIPPLSFALVAIFIAGCSILPTPQPAHHNAVPANLGEVWEYPASEFPTICILFKSSGTLEFRGGFLFFNKGLWKLNPVTGNTEMFLGGTDEFLETSGKSQIGKGPGALVGYDSKQRKLVYRIDSKTEFIEFAGFVFYRKETCSAP